MIRLYLTILSVKNLKKNFVILMQSLLCKYAQYIYIIQESIYSTNGRRLFSGRTLIFKSAWGCSDEF